MKVTDFKKNIYQLTILGMLKKDYNSGVKAKEF